MKKIFRMALVFALAGATLMYTGCSKDYTEDINNVKSSVNDLQNKLGELNNELSALKSSVSSLEAAYKAADDLIKGDVSDLKTRVGKVEEAVKDLSKYATKDELAAVEKKLTDLKADIKKTTDDLQKQINDLKQKLAADEEAIKKLQEAQKEVDNVYGFLSDELRAIVFQPDFYLGGVEATSYDFASFAGWEPVALKKAKELTVKVDTSTTKIVFPVGAKTQPARVSAQDPKDKTKTIYPNDMTQGQLGLATYDLNPSSFPVDSAEWAMIGRDVPYIVKSSPAKDWSVVVNEVNKNEANQAEVNFSIVNPENVFSTILAAFQEILAAGDTSSAAKKAAAAAAAKASIADVQLQATLSNDRLVVSDWHAVTSGEEFVDHLAFSASNKYVTNYDKDCGSTLDPLTKELMIKDLYFCADSAAANIPSVEVQYNGGGKDLAELISIHTLEAVNDTTNAFFASYTLAEFNKKYPGFSYKFELVPYTIGNNVTSEEMYGDIEGTWFTPCYVESTGGKPVSHKIEKDSEDGISSVGRMPIVLAYLVNDETGNSYAVGYFKIIITKEEREPETRTFEIPGLSKVPYICGPFTLKTNWHEFSYFVLENLKVDYAEFIKNYTLTAIYSNETLKKGKEEVEAFVPVVMISGDMTSPVDLKLDNSTLPEAYAGYQFKNAGKTLGTAIYEKDKSGTGINDAFEWTVNPQAIKQGESKSIFFRFESGPYDIVYFEMKADVAKAAEFDFGGNKISNEWYDDIDGEFKNTTRINVLVPNKTTDDVTAFYRDLNRFFIGYKPSVVLTDDSDPVYDNYFDPKADTTVYKPSELEGEYTFLFSESQPEIVFTDKDGKPITLVDSVLNDTTVVELSKAQLYVNATFDTLYVASYVKGDKGPEIKWADAKKTIPYLDTTHVIATIDTTGVITYYYDTTNVMSKKLLNLWSYTKKDQAQMLYANIHVDMTYGECEIPAGDADFHVRFVRPLDVNFGAADVAEESAVAGFNVLIAQFLKDITDWNKQAVVKITKDKNGKVTKVESNVISGVDMYKYYQFKKLILDLDKAERDHWKVGDDDARDLLKTVTPEAQLALGKVDSKGVFTPDGTNVLDISDPASLMQAVINYKNDRAVVETFNLFIPVSIEYAWGTIDEVLEIKVKPTSETTPHSL